jgi:hypothetical protein
MASISRLVTFKDAVVDLCRSVTGAGQALEGVEIWDVEPGSLATGADFLSFSGPDEPIESEWHMLGRGQFSRRERLVLRGYAHAARAGTDNVTIRATRARVAAILGELGKILVADPSTGGIATGAIVKPGQLIEGAGQQAERRAIQEFEIESGIIKLDPS